jgi:murein DD-endopeptidase MepM/ murein hydrolase activator NlpD
METQIKVKRRKVLMKKLKHKYRLVFFNDLTFEEVWHLRLSLLNVLSVVGTVSILMISLVIALMAFTPLRELIPGYLSENERRATVRNSLRLDSLDRQLHVRDHYFENLKALMAGEDRVGDETPLDKPKTYKNVKFTKSVQDSLLRKRIEEEEQFNFSVTSEKKQEGSISEIHFFPPVKGIVSNAYNAQESHFGIDIVGAPNEVVKATLDGTVVMASWTIETGWVIQIQHQNNIISVYKHNANLLKKVGNMVRAGDAIAIIGNSGELTTGPHLHFELWYNGKPVNPQDYIIFN